MNVQFGWTSLLDTKQDPLKLGKNKSRGLRSETSYRLMRSLLSRHFGRRKILGVLFLAGGVDFSLYKAQNPHISHYTEPCTSQHRRQQIWSWPSTSNDKYWKIWGLDLTSNHCRKNIKTFTLLFSEHGLIKNKYTIVQRTTTFLSKPVKSWSLGWSSLSTILIIQQVWREANFLILTKLPFSHD